MSRPELISSNQLTVALDYAQFSLRTREEDPDLAVELLIEAQAGDGIAQRGGLVVVESPHQNNFDMPLLVEVWSARPASDIDEWEEAFEVHLDVDEYGLVYESPTLESSRLPLLPGSYHAVISGRGFVGQGWPGSATPGDRWRIRLWPASGPAAPARLAHFGAAGEAAAEDDDESLEQQRRADATRAGQRILADLDQTPDARALSGVRGTAEVEAVLPREIAVVWELIANLDITLSSAPNERAVGNEFSMGTYNTDVDGFVGTDGQIVCRWTELEPPTRVVMSWTWTGPERVVRLSASELYARIRSGEPLPAHVTRLGPTQLDVTLTNLDTDPSSARVRVHLVHAGLPVEWIDDMTAVWHSKIDQWAYQSRPKMKRGE